MNPVGALCSRRTSHASLCHAPILDAERSIHRVASCFDLATHRADYELQDVKDIESEEIIRKRYTSITVLEVVKCWTRNWCSENGEAEATNLRPNTGSIITI